MVPLQSILKGADHCFAADWRRFTGPGRTLPAAFTWIVITLCLAAINVGVASLGINIEVKVADAVSIGVYGSRFTVH